MKKQLKDTSELSKETGSKKKEPILTPYEELKTTLQCFAEEIKKENVKKQLSKLEEAIKTVTKLDIKEMGTGHALQDVATKNKIIPNLIEITKESSEYPSVCRLIGIAYFHGFGVQENRNTARNYYKKAAEKGDTTAMCNLAGIYDNERNHKKAVKYWSQAAKKDDMDGMYHIGLCYRNGYARVIKKDIQTAKKWLEKSAENGNTKAMRTLGSIYYLDENNIKGSVIWWTKACKLGCEEAAYDLGLVYEYGRSGINQDIPKALSLYQASARKGYGSAIDKYNHLTQEYKIRIIEVNECITAITPAKQCLHYLEKINQAEDKTPAKMAFTMFINGMKEHEVKGMVAKLLELMPADTINCHLVEALLNHPDELMREPVSFTIKTSNGGCIDQVPTMLTNVLKETALWRGFNRATQVVSQWKGNGNATLPTNLQWMILSYIPRQGLPVDQDVAKNVLSGYRNNPENYPQPLALTMVENSGSFAF